LAFEHPAHPSYAATAREMPGKFQTRKFRRDNGIILAKRISAQDFETIQ
jgi:hypothetical protein